MLNPLFLGYGIQLCIAVGMLVSLAFYVVSYVSARSFFGAARVGNGHAGDDSKLPGVTILKPLKGLDIDLYENLSTYCRLDYPKYQIVLGVADPHDPAIRVVRRLQATHPDLHIDLVASCNHLQARTVECQSTGVHDAEIGKAPDVF